MSDELPKIEHDTTAPEFLQETIALMKPFISELDWQEYSVGHVLPMESAIFRKFGELQRFSTESIENLSKAMANDMRNEDDDYSSVQIALWKFLINQVEIRSAVIMEMSAILKANGAGPDVHGALCEQSGILEMLCGLIQQFSERGWLCSEEMSEESPDSSDVFPTMPVA